MTCFICREEESILYKLCNQCHDSTVCLNCYNLDELTIMNNCGICRKKYKYDYHRNYYLFFNELSYNFVLFVCILSMELFTPIILFLKTYNYIFLALTLFCIIIVNSLLYYFINKFFQSKQLINSLIVTKFAGMCFINFMLYLSDETPIQYVKIYSYLVFGILYIFPLFVISCYEWVKLFLKKRLEINNKTLKKSIHIYQILHRI